MCCISNALDVTEDDILWQDVTDENNSDCEHDGDEQSDREDSE
jgi:hypothetical protein